MAAFFLIGLGQPQQHNTTEITLYNSMHVNLILQGTLQVQSSFGVIRKGGGWESIKKKRRRCEEWEQGEKKKEGEKNKKQKKTKNKNRKGKITVTHHRKKPTMLI